MLFRSEYAILTDEISRAWSGMTTRQYKRLKGLKKENLRDNMTTLELVLNMLAEATTTEISKQKEPETFAENVEIARAGGKVAGDARKAVETQTGVPVITSRNAAQLNQVVTDIIEGVASEGIDKPDAPFANVTFEPRCRNNWHIHKASEGGGQMLVGVAGRGWYQEEGKPAQEILPGTVIHIPANVKHWHGAAADSWFAHLAFEIPGENTSNEWLEPVTEEEYDKLNPTKEPFQKE